MTYVFPNPLESNFAFAGGGSYTPVDSNFTFEGQYSPGDFSYPAQNQVDFEWGESTYSRTANFDWGVGYSQCDYYGEGSPLDVGWQTSVAYSPKVGAVDVDWICTVGTACNYVPVNAGGVVFVMGSPGYSAPYAAAADFILSCESGNQLPPAVAYGVGTFGPILSEGVLALFGLVSGECSFDVITTTGAVAVGIAAYGESAFDGINSSGDGRRGQRAMSSISRMGAITSTGGFEILPFFLASEFNFETGIVSAGAVTCGPVVMPSVMQFSTGIDFVRGRVEFGYPVAPIFRQLYELSNDRRMEVMSYPEECDYPIFIGDTHKDIDDNDIRVGTIRFSLSFDHDARDIDEIVVWVKNKDGHVFKDKAKIIDYPGGSYTDHILTDPFIHSYSLTIPIHCVTGRDNEMFLEIVYRQDDADVRVMREDERYFIPFQPHFDDKSAFANIADQFSSNTAKAGNSSFSSSFDELIQTFYFDSDSTKHILSCGSTPPLSYSFDELTKTFLFEQDGVNITLGTSGMHSFTFVSDDLSSGTIGG